MTDLTDLISHAKQRAEDRDVPQVIFDVIDLAEQQAAVIERAISESIVGDSPWYTEGVRKILKTAPNTVLAQLKADIWDEGFDAGERDAMLHETFDEPCIANPYRSGAQ